jgi:hypothetical protein
MSTTIADDDYTATSSKDDSTIPQRVGLLGRRLSWMTANTKSLPELVTAVAKEDPYIAEKFALLLNPPTFDRDDILCSTHGFMSSLVEFLPTIKLDKSFEILQLVRVLLNSPQCIRLFGLLTHYQYWNVVRPIAKVAIQEVRERTKAKKKELREQEIKKLQDQKSKPDGCSWLDSNITTSKLHALEQELNVHSLPVELFATVHTRDSDEIKARMQIPKAVQEVDERDAQRRLNLEETRKNEFLSVSHRDTHNVLDEDDAASHTNSTLEDHSVVEERSHSFCSIDDINDRFDNQIQKAPHSELDQHSQVPVTVKSIEEIFLGTAEGSLDSLSYQSTVTEASLTANEKEQLYIQLEMCIVCLFEQVMGRQ